MEYCDSEMLNRAMRNAGIRNGFDEIQAEFSAFRDFKLRWTRSYKWISFEVSDYLRNAPENVMQSLAETVFARIRGEDRTAYSEEVCDYLNSREFLEGNQGMYLKRFRGISETAHGESVDLLDCYRRLAERGLVEYDPDLVIRWSSVGDRSRKVGRSSVLMRTVVMNPAVAPEDSAHPTQTNPSRTGTESVTMNDLDPEADVPVMEAVWLAGAPEPPLALYSSVAVNVWVVRSHTA